MTGTVRPGLTDEQADIARTTEEYLAAHCTEADVRRAMDTTRGFEDGTWAQLSEMGLPGLAIPEEYGGVGLGLTELGLVLQATGASLLCAPLYSSAVLAGVLLTELGSDEAKADLLPGIADGSRRATAAYGPHPGLVHEATDGLRAERTPAGWVVFGRALHVIDGATADDILLVAGSVEGPVVLAVTADADGLSRSAMRTLDLTRRQAELVLDRVAAREVAVGPHVGPGVERVLDLAMLLMAAEQVGGAGRCLDTAVAYAGTRKQFDRIIGSFQAVKHTCANMLISYEGALAVMADGLRVADHLPPSMLPEAASIAKIACSEAYSAIASDALHVHGGIGFTWEQVSHLYFRRARSSEVMFGRPELHRDRLVTVAGLARPEGAA
ncbi:acyl-CoA dehydrogenase [Nakamurella sp. YIM 132087]|uniref:Acyl-CoA dehydrogenase n=1 Tax=Nakamurella alba TaxID=2665158 RepID=A0A7K1FP72_9ACTN|nr:acyl-CoA dehydrogenase family protein [Nakamurella alba]MTD15941.1 acyl-CoA dehydrogenase [Nakamurella alba]